MVGLVDWLCRPLGGLCSEPVPDAARLGFRRELEAILNRYSMENGSDTPDWILAEYLVGCLGAFDKALACREQWYGRTVSGKAFTPPPASIEPGPVGGVALVAPQ